MTKVIKRGCKKSESFHSNKIRKGIENAAKDAGFSPAQRYALIRDVGEFAVAFARSKPAVKSIEIRKSVLKKLDKKAKPVARAWRKFEKKKKIKKR